MNINNKNYNNKIRPNSKFMERLKKKLPEFFDKNDNFKLDKFKSSLENNNIKELQDGYQLNFIGKNYARQQTGELPHTVIAPDKVHNKSEFNKHSKNLYLSGDNLEGLRHLQASYYHKIDAICIDPPFNTGSDDFIYPDNFELSDNILKEQFNLTDKQLKQLKNIRGTSTHSAWLTFMYPRLYLAKNLLRNHGLIFIFIDDNEQADLKILMNDIFGENDFVSQIAVETSKAQGLKVRAAEKGEIVGNKQYVLLYEFNNNNDYSLRKPLYDYNPHYDAHFSKILVKNKLVSLCDYIYKNTNQLKLIDNISNQIHKKFVTKNLSYFLKMIPEISKFINSNANRIFEDAAANFNIPNNVKHKINSDCFPVKFKKYLLIRTGGNKIRQLLPLKNTFHLSNDLRPKYGRSVIRGDLWKGFSADMMNINKEGNVAYKNGKKPVRLIQQLLEWSGIKNGIIMDFFAGSATTADAVMRNNIINNSNNSYIMMQINNPIYRIKYSSNGHKKVVIAKGAKSAYKQGYKTLDQIGLKRISNSEKVLRKNHPLKANKLDLGFKHFYITKSDLKSLNSLSLNDLSFDDNTEQLHMFDPYNVINSFSSKELCIPCKCNGFDTLLSTFLIDDGYNINADIHYVNLKGYNLPIISNEQAYILSSDWHNEQTRSLLNLIGNNNISIQTVVIFKYTVSFADVKELENGLNQLDVRFIERF
ncbi:site-specific DNA-methyltransferase [Acetilactobacillus jinshanensis]|uniref:Site-specific DNA-methyltransferase n=1 Tax=Acetilactobacillus jinshanensis TaxID=1720083 RepID=A0A4P6ZL88_9LACO|nr:site-specific DNA-methyltransferase [Acetilactobacillus jinshanensis]QBP18182.1 site-specific DNA-methyltransferase [Acetilactobacillus jinshanensis]URL61049.1 site-specific DNA-methyltransferase [uncultured bacterium]